MRDHYAQTWTRDSNITNKWPAQINNVHKMSCHPLGHRGQKPEICRLFKADREDWSVFDGGQSEDREQRRSRGILQWHTPGIQRIKFQCVSCLLINHPSSKTGLHLWMTKIPLGIQHCLSTWQYGGLPSLSLCLPPSRWPSVLCTLFSC